MSTSTSPKIRRRPARIVVFVTAGVVAAAATGGGVAYASQQRTAAQIADLTAATVAAQQAEKDAVSTLETVIARAEQRLVSDVDQVADPATLTALAEAVEVAKAEQADAAAVPEDATVDQAQAALDAANAEVAAAASARRTLSTALTAELASNTRFRLDQGAAKADETKAALDAAISAAQQALTDSEGKVADDAVRQNLAEVLGQAQTIADGPVDQGSLLALDWAVTNYQSATTEVQEATAAVTDAVAAKVEADRLAAEAAAKAAAEKTGRETNRSSAGRPSSSTAPATPPENQSITSIVEVEAARFGMTVRWVQLSGYAGLYSGGDVMDIDPDSRAMRSAADARTVVRHEAAHRAIANICGTATPAIADGRGENVTDAWADIFHGGLSYRAYGYNASDAAIAKAIKAGQCVTAAQNDRQVNLKVGDRVRTLAETVEEGVIHGVVEWVNGSDVGVKSDSGKGWTISRSMLDLE